MYIGYYVYKAKGETATAQPQKTPPNRTAIHMFLDDDLVRRLDAYRFDHHIPSRVETVTLLLNNALDAEQKETTVKPPAGTRRSVV